MFDNLKHALGVGAAARPAPMPTHAVVKVPVHRAKSVEIDRPGATMGFLDRAGHLAKTGVPTPLMPTLPLRTADQNVRGAWGAVAGSLRHLISNSGWLSGSIDQFVGYAIGGQGLVPNVEPDREHLGWSEEEAKQFAKDVERLFADWCRDPLSADDRGQLNFAQIQAAALRGWFATGDVMAAITYTQWRPGSRYKTGVMGVDATRIMTPPLYSSPGGMRSVFHGIETDTRGTAVAYWLRPNPGETALGARIPRFLSNGRIGFVHSFIGEPSQVRGVSPFASVVEALSQTVSLQDAILIAAHSAASIIGTVTSDLPNESVAKALGADGTHPLIAMQQARNQWHEGLAESRSGVSLGSHGKVFHLTSGERFELHAGKTIYQNYPEHLRALLREISRASGLPYEMLSLDRSAATYSSGRLGLLDFWGLVELRRAALVEPLCNVVLHAFVEEVIDRGLLKYPGAPDNTVLYRGVRVKAVDDPLPRFRDQRTFALKTRWTGPPPPQIDELKSVRASAERLLGGFSSLREEYGPHWSELLDQIAHERQTMQRLQIPAAWPETAAPPPAQSQPASK